MLVNYKFKYQVDLKRFHFSLDRSVDIEVSTFQKLSDLDEIRFDLSDIRSVYNIYYGYDDSRLVSDLDIQDLHFLLFLKDISSFNFDKVTFDGSFIPVVGYHGKDYEFVLYVNEG